MYRREADRGLLLLRVDTQLVQVFYTFNGPSKSPERNPTSQFQRDRRTSESTCSTAAQILAVIL